MILAAVPTSQLRSLLTSSGRGAALSVACLLVGLLLTACGDRSASPAAGSFTPRSPGVLTVVTSEVPSEGFWQGSPDHLTGGLEYELARNLAERFGLSSVRIKLEPFQRIVAGQLDGADLALDLITPTAQRGQRLDFSSPYLDAAPTVVVRSGTDVSDLATAQMLRWGAVQGTTLQGIIDTLVAPDAPVRTYGDDALMLAGLRAHEIDAVLLDLPLAVVTAQRSRGRLEAVAQLPQPETIAAALPKGSKNVQAVDSAIRAFTADGTINDLLRTWIGPSAADAEDSIPLLRTTR